MSHARIEEVSDSDLSDGDPSEGDIDDFVDSDILRAVAPKQPPAAAAPQQQQRPQQGGQPNSLFPGTTTPAPGGIQQSDVAGYQCLYPIYFDASRTRAEGRRVPSHLAVKNPLAREIAAACAALRVSPVFEAMKTHPQDWANPGRVRVNIKDPSNPYLKDVKNKHHLYLLVAEHLRANPTGDRSAGLRNVRIPGLPGHPKDDEKWPKPAVPKSWKINEYVPAYSSAMTGGGVSENALRDMMKEMGGMGGAPGGGGPGGMGGMADMMNMLGGMGGMGGMPGMGGPSGSGGQLEEGGGKKDKKKGKK
ncbi:signal recognition particle subunit [Neopestalotiopsis sp. 37M]|nr:signal recognition particle subunit [Neopestalotiopsis sp. 37M]